MLSPAKSPKPSVPESIKAELAAKALDLMENVLKPLHVLPPEPDAQRNYITDLSAQWNRGYFYFTASYASPGRNAPRPPLRAEARSAGGVEEVADITGEL